MNTVADGKTRFSEVSPTDFAYLIGRVLRAVLHPALTGVAADRPADDHRHTRAFSLPAFSATEAAKPLARGYSRGEKRLPSEPSRLVIISLVTIKCQSAFKFDPASASNFDPFGRRVLAVALAPSELVGVAETVRARAA